MLVHVCLLFSHHLYLKTKLLSIRQSVQVTNSTDGSLAVKECLGSL
jgi:hypothetical protein